MTSPALNRLTLRRAGALLLVGMVLLIALSFASGRLRYVVTHGISMQPLYHTGDLIILAPAGAYHIGEIVAYDGGPSGHLEILHRIIGGNAGGYLVKGDNNQSVDPTHPGANQLIGRAILHVPQVGGIVASPITHAVMVIAVLALLYLLVKKPAPRPGAAYGSRRASDQSTAVWKSLLVVDLLLVAAVGLAFGLLSSPMPAAKPAFNQTGTLSYQGRPGPSDTYPSGTITTGDPVFVKLVHRVGVSFRYRTDAPASSVRGTVQIDAAESTASGWHTDMRLVAPTALVAGAADVTTTLDLGHIQAIEDRVARATQVGVESVGVVVTATVQVKVGSDPPVTFRTQLPLVLSPVEMAPSGAKLTKVGHGSAVVASSPLTALPSPRAHSSPGVSHGLRLLLLALLIAAAASTAVVWPSRPDRDQKRAVMRTKAVGIKVAPSTNQIHVPDRATLVQVALALDGSIVQGDDGWEGVFGPDTLYWSVTPPSPPSPPPAPPGDSASTNGHSAPPAPMVTGA